MAQGKQTPRQKMINLMYLVFIAMLAMQIDQEIIRSYDGVSKALTSTRTSVEDKTHDIFETTLDEKAKTAPDKFAIPQQDYKNLKERADDLVKTIEGWKTTLKKDSEYNPDPNMDVEENFVALNNTEAVSNMFFTDSDENKPSKTAAELKSKVENLRKFINDTFTQKDSTRYYKDKMASIVTRANKLLVTDFPNGKKMNEKNWMQYKFYGQPLIAGLSNLEVIQSDARNLQADILVMLLQDVDLTFSGYMTLVSAPDVIPQGSTIEPFKVAIGTYADNLEGLEITGVDRVENGVGYKTISTAGLGENLHFAGVVKFIDADGRPKTLDYDHTYRIVPGTLDVAFESGALLSADKMNVLYRGLDNPISGSILGADNTQTSLAGSNAAVTKTGNGTWMVRPGAGKETTLSIVGKGPKGETIKKDFVFRIKPVPPPAGQIQSRGKSVVTMPASSVANQTVTAVIPDFDFPVTFTVTSFLFKMPGKAATTINGNSLSSVAPMMTNVRSGESVQIYGIKATASGLGDMQIPEISPIIINVQ
ncbi:MAG: gliding motility protein GldM [Flavobacteriaceae bacterium]|jgi:gliding motility-associated protein GldM|nr:gliding motility protein GldM [Flavobacteriaceae bacterium]